MSTDFKIKVETGKMWEVSQNHVSLWGYLTEHPWEAIFQPNYFLPIQNWFRTQKSGGKAQDWRPDEIYVRRPVRVGTELYYEIGTVIVTYADEKRVTVAPLTAPMCVGAPEGTLASWPPPPEEPSLDESHERPSRRQAAA